jgi:hypothetical protein
MDIQAKVLNKQYLETRIREIKEIKRKEIIFDIEESDRVFSKTLYVNFYCQGEDSWWFKGHTLRISDHFQENCPHSQFIINPSEWFTKKKKVQFMKTLENAVKKAKTRCFYKELKKLSTDE